MKRPILFLTPVLSSLQVWNSFSLFHAVVRIKIFLLFNLRSKISLNTTSEGKFQSGTQWTVLSFMDVLKIAKKRLIVIKKKDMSFFLWNWHQRVIFETKIKTTTLIKYFWGVWETVRFLFYCDTKIKQVSIDLYLIVSWLIQRGSLLTS